MYIVVNVGECLPPLLAIKKIRGTSQVCIQKFTMPSTGLKQRTVLSKEQVIAIFQFSSPRSPDKPRPSACSVARMFGVIGFIIYWVGIVLGIGTRVTEDEIDSDPKI